MRKIARSSLSEKIDEWRAKNEEYEILNKEFGVFK